MKLWIVGASGMLGQDIVRLAREAGHWVLATDRELDFTQAEILAGAWKTDSFDFCINCAAYTAVDKAESEEELALRINAVGPQNLAKLCAERGAGLIHISTDYVLQGQSPNPLQESDHPNPINAYGRTKLEGEKAVAKCPRHWNVRTAWLYGLQGPNFVKTMLRLLRERGHIRVVDDQWGCPTWTEDLAIALLKIIEQNKSPGIYHYAGSGPTTWCSFAREIGRLAAESGILKRDWSVEGISTADYPTPARRPSWSVLDTCKVTENFGVQVRPWQDSLASYMALEVARGT